MASQTAATGTTPWKKNPRKLRGLIREGSGRQVQTVRRSARMEAPLDVVEDDNNNNEPPPEAAPHTPVKQSPSSDPSTPMTVESLASSSKPPQSAEQPPPRDPVPRALVSESRLSPKKLDLEEESAAAPKRSTTERKPASELKTPVQLSPRRKSKSKTSLAAGAAAASASAAPPPQPRAASPPPERVAKVTVSELKTPMELSPRRKNKTVVKPPMERKNRHQLERVAGFLQVHEDTITLEDDSMEMCFLEFLTNSIKQSRSKRRGSLNALASGSTDHEQEAREQIIKRINQDYTETVLRQAGYGHTGVQVHLFASDWMLEKFFSVQTVLEESNLPSDLPERIFRLLEDFIQPRIADIYSNATAMETLTAGEAAKIITWMDAFLVKMQKECPDVEPAAIWREDQERMLQHYLECGVRKPMSKAVSESLDMMKDDDLRQNADDHIVSGLPEIILFLVESQISVAQEELPEACVQRVLATCNTELSVMVSEIMLQMGLHWKSISLSRYCAVINDSSRLADTFDERNEELLQDPDLQVAGDAMLRDLAELALHATNFLCERILMDLKDPDPILTKVGDADWESDETGTAVSTTVATLEDFFSDLESWMQQGYYFPKVLRKCFDMTLQTYVESFFANTMQSGIQDPDQVAKTLDEDYMGLFTFFNGEFFDKYHGQAGFYTAQDINWRLRILQSLMRTIRPSVEPDELLDDVLAIMDQFECRGPAESGGSSGGSKDDDGVPAILHLAGLRKRHTTTESVEWIRVIGRAQKQQARSKQQQQQQAPSKQQQQTEIFYRPPDLRNSQYIENIRINRRELERTISQESMVAVQATCELLLSKRSGVGVKVGRMGRRLSLAGR